MNLSWCFIVTQVSLWTMDFFPLALGVSYWLFAIILSGWIPILELTLLFTVLTNPDTSLLGPAHISLGAMEDWTFQLPLTVLIRLGGLGRMNLFLSLALEKSVGWILRGKDIEALSMLWMVGLGKWSQARSPTKSWLRAQSVTVTSSSNCISCFVLPFYYPLSSNILFRSDGFALALHQGF